MENEPQQEINRAIKHLVPNRKSDTTFISSYHKENKGRIRVIVQLEENPFKTVVFHEVTFQKIRGRWVLVDFELDA